MYDRQKWFLGRVWWNIKSLSMVFKNKRNNMKLHVVLLTVTFALSAVFTACDKEKEKEKNVSVTGIMLNKTSIMIAPNCTVGIRATLDPYNATNNSITWSSSNLSVAMVNGVYEAMINGGYVTAIAEGTAVITATTDDGKKTASCVVTVINPEPEMVFVEGGAFTMGCTDYDCYEWKQTCCPAHQVTLSSFKIGKYSCTQVQYEAVMGSNPSKVKGDNLPVTTVRDNALAFITKLNESTGKNYRLPTEAEWEYAARGGNKSKGYTYSGSNNIDEVAWYSENSNNQIHPVGTKAPNELGIYDMSGNVWEECSDWYGVYSDELQTNPQGPATGSFHVNRGGSFLYHAYPMNYRANFPLPINSVGFRLVHP